MNKVLIIKTGESECFVDSPLSHISLGDVLRTTVILSLFEGDKITWLTSPEASPLLTSHPHLHVMTDKNSLEPSSFDRVILLEKTAPWISWVKGAFDKNKIYGFVSECGHFRQGGPLLHSPLRLKDFKIWQKGLFLLLGKTWAGEEYVYHPRRKVPERFDVGLNWKCGPRWPNKQWPQKNWEALAKELSSSHTLSWQQGFDDIDAYVDWIQSCSTLITTDSLGLHLALALKKKVVAFFGPTAAEQIPLYGKGLALSPSLSLFPCAPCFAPRCSREMTCMEHLSVNNALRAFEFVHRGGKVHADSDFRSSAI
jgi:heptosyltransferase-2